MEPIYLGRIVAVAITLNGFPAALYRVSSRSFPNRQAEIGVDGDKVAIVPKAGYESDIRKNPYIAYNCARIIGKKAILANGSHADPVAEKIASGMPIRDALALASLAMDYEKDEYNTPRITAVADAETRLGWLASVRHDGLDVMSFGLEPGQVVHLSTYEHNIPSASRVSAFTAETAEAACDFVLAGGVFKSFTNPVTAVAAVAEGGKFRLFAKDVR